MYESPITKIMGEIQQQIIQDDENNLLYQVRQSVGYSVDKEELLKALNYDRDQYRKGYQDGFNADKWIPVSERLPEETFGCLVTVEVDDIYGEPHRFVYPDSVGYDGETWNDGDGEVIHFYVIAWMPLPEPYKAESEDKK